jgi:hypothetical protein
MLYRTITIRRVLFFLIHSCLCDTFCLNENHPITSVHHGNTRSSHPLAGLVINTLLSRFRVNGGEPSFVFNEQRNPEISMTTIVFAKKFMDNASRILEIA